ncbi:MAG: amidohydrolase family protein [Candidatus Rokubacteria bacterium]|nr:amidohydrolase family protein [Candidatus Rokubacteria bacterium]MBI3827125.1 amidohydrolase family protein [Candidatus Rokubacteria bacterium]
MLDLVIRNGQVVTPEGAGAWDIGIEGERIAAVALPGTLPAEAAKVIDAAGKLVVPGGIDPHTHLAHSIMSHPEQPSLTLGPEDDTRGMAFGGTTTHIDFCYVRPGVTIPAAIEQRAARWKASSYVDYAFHVTLAGALDFGVFEQIPDAIKEGYPTFKVFTTNILPPHPKRQGNRLDFGRIGYAMEKIAPAGGLLVVHGEDEDLVQFNYERFIAEKRAEGTNLHLVHSKLSELLAFRRTVTLARALDAAVYFVHTSAKEGVDTIREARANGQPVYGETLHQYCCFNAEYYKTPRGFCSHTYPSLKFPEDQQALWHGLVHDGLSTLATDEYPTSLEIKLRGRRIDDVTGGNVGAEARMGIGYSEGVVKRGMSLARFADVTSSNAAKIFGLYPRKGAIAPGSDADLCFIDPAVRKTLTRDDFHVTDYSPWEGWSVTGWPVTTILRGKVIVDGGRLLGSTTDGRSLSRKIDPSVLRRPAC